jgi:sec-independent protein translocase protein TatA
MICFAEPHANPHPIRHYIGSAARRHPGLDLFEIILILAVALVVLGPERLPEVLRTAGKVMRELRAASNTVMRELSEALDEDPSRTAATRPALPSDQPPPATKPPEQS